MTDFTVLKNLQPQPELVRENIKKDPGFGQYFTDHMAHIRYTVDDGWQGHEVRPYGPLLLDPAAAVLHYAQEIFEGLKAYRHADGSVWTFRPERNAARINKSAERLALPQLSEEDFIDSLKQLVSLDQAWVPTPESEADESSMYLRPFMIATERFLGVRASHEADYYVIASPAGPYFPRGVQPLVVWITDEYARAGAGGTGAAKCGGNYASSLLGKREAAENGADEVLFLDSETHTSIDELSGMNVVAITKDGRLLTPSLTGSILEGVTRLSILRLAEDRGLEVHEQKLVMSEVEQQLESGEITEMFACGTAAVINPIGEFRSRKGSWTVGDGGSGEVTLALRKELTDIQYGRIPDRHGWLTRLV